MAAAMVQINVRIPPELADRLKAEQARTQSTATAVVTKALEKHLRAHRGRESMSATDDNQETINEVAA